MTANNPKRTTAADLKAAMEARSKKRSDKAKKTAAPKRVDKKAGTGLSGAIANYKKQARDRDDTGYLVSVCFNTKRDLDAFKKDVLGNMDAIQPGGPLADRLGIDTSVNLTRPRRKPQPIDIEHTKWAMSYQHPTSPLDGLKYTDDHEVDAFNEASTLLSALERGPSESWQKQHGTPIDSPHWVCLWFLNRRHSLNFLIGAGLHELGDDYIDGHKASPIIKATLDG